MSDVIQELVKALSSLKKADGTPDWTTDIYGNGGLFGICGNNPTLINATVSPLGFEGYLRWIGADDTNPIFDAMTYVGTTTTAQTTGCADCGKPVFHACAQTACFGRICQQTNEAQFDEIGLRQRGVPRLALFGDITLPDGTVVVRRGQEIHDQFMLDVMGSAYNLRLDHATMLWTGNPASDAGARRNFAGFQLLVNTGKVDAITNAACTALDSYLLDYGSNVVGAVGSPSILAYIGAIIRSVLFRAGAAGFSQPGVVGYLVMHPTLWDCVADAAACEYGLVCNVGATSYNDAMEVARRRDEMKAGQYLTIDGRRWPVVLDSQIPYTANGANRCSDIYFITTSVDGQTITWGEYQDFNTTGGPAMAEFRRLFGAQPVAITDGGRFAVAYSSSGGFCFDIKTLLKARVKMLMPWLSGRVQNVCCAPLAVFPDVTGSGGTYERDGGRTTTPQESLYGDCDASVYDPGYVRGLAALQ